MSAMYYSIFVKQTEKTKVVNEKYNETVETITPADDAPSIEHVQVATDSKPTVKHTPKGKSVPVRRNFKSEWLNKYAWLKYDSTKNTMFCTYCSTQPAYAGKTDFVCGSTNFKKETLAIHSLSVKHLHCRDISLNKQQKRQPLKEGFKAQECNASESIKNDLMIKMNTAFAMSKEEIPFTKFKTLLALQKKNGLEISYSYANDVKCAEFVGTIASVTKGEIESDLEHAKYFSVMFDSATDSSVKETEAVIIRYVKDGKPVNKLLGLAELKHAHADGIMQSISDQFSKVKKDDYQQDLVSFCADGASVNHGERGGVKSKLKVTCPWIIGIWCLPHRLELAVTGMLKSNEMAAKVIRVLDFLYKTYHFSCKSRRELKLIGEELGLKSKNPSRATGTRWTPHLTRALGILLKPRKNGDDGDLGQYAALTQHSEHLAATSKNSDVQGRAKFVAKLLKCFKFAAFCHFLLDLLQVISQLSVRLQSDKVILPTALAALQTCLSSLQALELRVQPGGYFEAFLVNINSQVSQGHEEITLQGTVLNNTPDELDIDISSLPLNLSRSIKDASKKASEGLMDRFQALLGSTQPETIKDGAARVVSSFRIFNADTWPEDAMDLSTYGESEVQYLLDWFHSRLERNGCNIRAVIHQWGLLKQLVTSDFAEKNYTSLFSTVLVKEPYKTDLRDLLHLVEIMLVLPISSASCERVFSAQKRIKTDTRSSLGVDTVEDLIRISADPTTIEDFTPQPAVLKWLSSSERPRRPAYTEWPSDVSQSAMPSNFCLSSCCAEPECSMYMDC